MDLAEVETMLMVARTLPWVLKSEGGNSFADGSWGTGG